MIRYKRVYEYSLTTEAALLDNNETTAKSTTQDGGMAETSVNAFVSVSYTHLTLPTKRIV